MAKSITSQSEPRVVMIQWKVLLAQLSGAMYKVGLCLHEKVYQNWSISVPPKVTGCTALPVYDYYSNNLTRIEIEWDPVLVSQTMH